MAWGSVESSRHWQHHPVHLDEFLYINKSDHLARAPWRGSVMEGPRRDQGWSKGEQRGLTKSAGGMKGKDIPWQPDQCPLPSRGTPIQPFHIMMQSEIENDVW